MLQVDPHRLERFEVKLLHIHRWRLQNELELRVLEQPIGILAVSPVGRPPRRLRVAHLVRLRPQHAQKRLRTHRARAHFHVVGLLQHASSLRPERLQAEQKILKSEGTGFYARFGLGCGHRQISLVGTLTDFTSSRGP